MATLGLRHMLVVFFVLLRGWRLLIRKAFPKALDGLSNSRTDIRQLPHAKNDDKDHQDDN